MRTFLVDSPVPRVVAEGRPVVIADAAVDESWPGYREDARTRGYHTTVILSLGVGDARGRPMAMAVQAREVVPVVEDDLAFLQTVAHQAALAVSNARRLEAEQRTAGRLQSAFRVHTELMQAVLDDAPLERLFELIESLLDAPMVVLDATANVIHGGHSPLPERLDDDAFRALLGSRGGAAFLLDLVRAAPAEGVGPLRDVDLAPLGAGFRARVLVEPLIVDGQLLGGLLVFAGPHGLDDLQALAASEAKFALAMHMMRSHARFLSAAELHADLLSRLFSGDWRHASEVVTRAGYLGINLERPARLLVLAAGGASPARAGVDLAWRHRRLARIAERLWPGAKVVSDGDEWVFFLPGDTDTEAARGGAERLRAECEPLFDAEPALALSAPCAAPADYAEARRACARSLSLARALGRRGVLADEDLGPGAVLLSAAGDEQVRRFMGATLGALAAHDRASDGALIETLDTYLRLSCRPTATAERLGIHISTLRYRLERIRDVGGVDLADADQRFSLELALRLRELLPDEPPA